jgi:thioredoxin-like negative regulator of GroEL
MLLSAGFGMMNMVKRMKKVLFGYVTACGTCKMSEYMLDVVAQTLTFDVEKVNLNLNKALIDAYQITSTPVFIFLNDNQVVDQFYAARSVVYLHEKISGFLNNTWQTSAT